MRGARHLAGEEDAAFKLLRRRAGDRRNADRFRRGQRGLLASAQGVKDHGLSACPHPPQSAPVAPTLCSVGTGRYGKPTMRWRRRAVVEDIDSRDQTRSARPSSCAWLKGRTKADNREG